MSTAILTGAKIAPKTAFNEKRGADVLDELLCGACVPVLSPWQQKRLEREVRDLLWQEARRLVKAFNTVVETDALYLMACGDMWVLLGRPGEYEADRKLMHGVRDISALMRLVERLEKGLRDIVSEKERVCV